MSVRRQSEEKRQYGSRGSIKATLAERRETVKGLSKPEKRHSRELASSSRSLTPDHIDKQKIQKSKKVNGNSLEQQQSHATTDSNNTNTSEQTSSGGRRGSSQVNAADTVQGDPTCSACVELTKGSITQFMASNKFLEKCPERIEGFNLYDYADEGCIRGDDLSSALSAVGYIVSPGELVTVCKHLNIRKNTEVDFRLFTAVIAHQIMSCTENQIISAFRLFDKEGRGSIDAKELKHITRVLGVQTDEDQIDDMVREVDVDGDGDIDFEEFVNMIRKQS